ncbi:hypothetical protein ASPWEDRAFT_42589 [Aspergillus wentii DTO 134E9]|uniref:Apple domain-containing protein n=1 Tax=Aspergillus wentii DTO 134E9 TaxID=1073089 RepID=A0A1L9RI70_ASPWE|nr:uncharacterized protein ASPWEDRAFT_42589 [Aspergillus wentii DTO 134E9]KAI9925932.1 hypothetical protein MW887_005738 [Aspergillus wentii]OJJ34615.1 hypothetical protein ASPWEDRAFT_42589 [Aspergillus wentii DTO 134E9]
MKLQTILLSLPLASVATAEVTLNKLYFDRLCPKNEELELEISPNVFVTYSCHRSVATSVKTAASDAEDPYECAMECSKTKGCVGGLWSGRVKNAEDPCSLAMHAAGEPELRNRLDVVYMAVRDGNAEPVECAEEAKIIHDLISKNEALKKELEECKTHSDDDDDDEATTPPTPPPSKEWTIKTGHHLINHHYLSPQGGNGRRSLDDCMALCEKTTGCQGVTRNRTTGTCWLARDAKPPTRVLGQTPNANLDSAILK